MSEFHGADAALADLDTLIKGSRQEFARALTESLKENDVPRVIEATPLDTGDLRDTVSVVEPEIEGSVIRSGIAAGGGEVDYALKVHEDLEARHLVGGAKYIEKPLKDSVSLKPQEIGSRVDLDRVLRS